MKILVTGDWQHPDFVDGIAQLPPRTKFCEIKALDQTSFSPELLVLAQSRRNQFDSQFAERLRNRWPMAPAVQLLSSWMEGETRSGKPFPGWNRVPWHRWPADFARHAAARRAGRPSLWDNSKEPGMALAAELKQLPGGKCLAVGIAARWNSEAALYQQMIASLGHATQTLPLDLTDTTRKSNVDALILVGDSCDVHLLSRLRKAKLVYRGCPKIVVLGFPRRHEVNQIQQIGGRNIRVLSKPFEINQVQQYLQAFGMTAP